MRTVKKEDLGSVSLQKGHCEKAIKVACQNGNLQKYEDSQFISMK